MRLGIIFPEQVYGLSAFSGGIQRRVYEISSRLAKRGHQVTLFSPSSKQMTKNPLPNVTIEPIPVRYFLQPQMSLSFNLSTLARLMYRHDFDIIETHLDVGAGALLSKSFSNADFRVIQVIHGLVLDEVNNILKYKPVNSLRSALTIFNMLSMGSIELICSKMADAVVTVNQYAVKKLVKMGIPLHKISVIFNGVDMAKFNPHVDGSSLRKRILGKDDGYIILFVGRLSPRKGVNSLIQAFYKITKDKPFLNPKLIIVGDGPESSRLRKLTQMLGVESSILFVGNLAESQLPEYYAACDVFCLPSLQEAMGIAVLEAQASGKPTVATHVGGLPEIVIHERTGILVPAADSRRLATALEALATDSSLKNELGKAAIENAKRFSWQKVTKLTEVTYTRLLNG